MGWGGYGYGYYWKPYVSVAERRRRAARKMDSLRKKGVDVQPVVIDGRKIAKSFWGEAWCGHLESFSDFENRLPRGRTYVRNGSVCHLAVAKGRIEAKVSGSELYDVKVSIKTLPGKQWSAIDILENDKINEKGLTALVHAAADFNHKKAGAKPAAKSRPRKASAKP